MTDAQRSYLETLCRETGEEFDDALTKAEASKRIDELRARSPRLSESVTPRFVTTWFGRIARKTDSAWRAAG